MGLREVRLSATEIPSLAMPQAAPGVFGQALSGTTKVLDQGEGWGPCDMPLESLRIMRCLPMATGPFLLSNRLGKIRMMTIDGSRSAMGRVAGESDTGRVSHYALA
jgi:hypothetical protein